MGVHGLGNLFENNPSEEVSQDEAFENVTEVLTTLPKPPAGFEYELIKFDSGNVGVGLKRV